MRLRFSLVVLTLFLPFCITEFLRNHVRTSLNSKWKHTSLLSEMSEYVAQENEQNFWKFVEAVNSANVTTNSEQSFYEVGYLIAEKMLDPTELGLFRLAISMRIMSPRVEIHRQLGQKRFNMKCSTFYVYGKQNGCHLSKLNIVNHNEENPQTYEFDHIYPLNSNASRTLFIYGQLGYSGFKKMFYAARQLADSEKNLRLVVRHFKPFDPSQSEVSLSGYGVELALKNTEYKAMDSTVGNEESENLHGFNFKILKEKHINFEKELDSLRDDLEKLGEVVPLKGWQLKDLGFQTCQKMKNMAVDDIETLLQDFPTNARALSHMKLDEPFQAIVKTCQEKMNSKGIASGTNLLAINGRIVSKGDTFIDIFSLVNTLKQEKKVVDDIQNNGFEANVDAAELLTLVDMSPADISQYAFDYRDTLPHYLNDLEATRGRFRSLNFMLQPFAPGQIRPISRNIFTLVIFIDPFKSNDRLYDMVRRYASDGIYIRFGIVPVFNEKLDGINNIEDAVNLRTVADEKKSLWKTKTSLLNALRRGNEFLQRTGLSEAPVALLNGYPLDVSSIEKLETSLLETVQKQTTRLQMALFGGLIHDSENIQDWWLNESVNTDLVKRVNKKITSAFREKKFLNLGRKASPTLKKLHYFTENSDKAIRNTNIYFWIIVDVENSSHRKLSVDLLKHLSTFENYKVAIVPNRKNAVSGCRSELPVESIDFDQFIDALKKNQNFGDESLFCLTEDLKSLLSTNGMNSENMFIVSNGLIIGPLTESDTLTYEDLVYLDNLWISKGAETVASYLNSQYENDVSVQFYSAISGNFAGSEPRIGFNNFKDEEKRNMISFPSVDPSNPSVTVTWIANPVSREAQQIVSIIKLISRCVNSRVEIIFNPPSEISEMPIQRFYRFIANNAILFGNDGEIRPNSAIFSTLPQKQLLTMSVETNDAWIIELNEAQFDMDNILLDMAAQNVEGTFSLEHILIEGQSYKQSGVPSDGVEIELQSDDKKYDTIVMMNLGYFQLKAEPGLWELRLRNGSSTEKYRITEVDSKNAGEKIEVVVDSFMGKWIQLLVAENNENIKSKKSGLESLMQTAKNLFSHPDPSEVINVFSLASGHLYERFMRIMIVSVMKNTKTQKVKFWLLKNYLSPSFKRTIHLLADYYKFDYELVDYKWPKWLHQQTEKQRVMWGYKILFLDVLFPLNVEKIIFVDADQVVRADLQELMDFNLRGAPYGYVPFCESRKEMDGFRFWKSGYWMQHLMGRSYHISALYVVDLKAFRKLSAGDRLRGRYEMLSSDPNSLSNLDQDLPNNMIHEIPIKSLPQEWLWCETWCSDGSKNMAKTIDLCNNPLTKEPKLTAAQRIIGEWKDLDNEITDVLNQKIKPKTHIKLEL